MLEERHEPAGGDHEDGETRGLDRELGPVPGTRCHFPPASIANRFTSIVPSVATTGASCCTRASQPAVHLGPIRYRSRSKPSILARMRIVRGTSCGRAAVRGVSAASYSLAGR